MIELNPNSWSNAEWWFEDEPEVLKFMQENEEEIIKYSIENGITIRDTIDYLFKKGVII